MKLPDLTPSQYIEQSKAEAALKRWTVPLAFCAFVSLLVIVIENAQAPDMHGKLAEDRVVQARTHLEENLMALAVQRDLLSQSERELQAEQYLTQRPDWAEVLRLIANQFDDELVMTGCRLGQASGSRIRGQLGPLQTRVADDSVWLILTGVSSVNSKVPGLILRLESLGLFERVVMTDSERTVFAGESRTSFVLACQIPLGGHDEI